ncbi:unnamed protein product, partial [marine sediment metagenome]
MLPARAGKAARPRRDVANQGRRRVEALYSEEIRFLVETYQKYIKTKEVGVHCHNNQQLAFANTIEGIIRDANYVDGTLFGLGRSAGNCPLELLLGFLKNPKFNITPILDVISKTI